MKLTKRQSDDIECIKYFIPQVLKHIDITDSDIEKFLEYSEQGKHKGEHSSHFNVKDWTGFNALCEGKRWRGIHVHELYEKGILDGVMPYIVILEDMPRVVVNFLKKEMFQGIDTDIIEKCYQQLCQNQLEN